MPSPIPAGAAGVTAAAVASSAWAAHRATLADLLPDHVWRWVNSAYHEANEVNWRIAKHRRGGRIAMPETNWLRQPFETIRRAMEALEAQFGPRAGIWAYTGYASIDEIAETLWPSKDEGLGTDRAPGDEAPE